MNCPKCNYSNPDENNFCGNCGTKLPAGPKIGLKDLIDAGMLKAGEELTINVRGKDVTATLLADGRIKYQDKTYEGPLACAAAVRGQTCDSWSCWRVTEATGASHGIGHYRSALQRQKREAK
jgi:hypothetical protein